MLQGAVGTEGANKANEESWGTTGMGWRRHSREGGNSMINVLLFNAEWVGREWTSAEPQIPSGECSSVPSPISRPNLSLRSKA